MHINTDVCVTTFSIYEEKNWKEGYCSLFFTQKVKECSLYHLHQDIPAYHNPSKTERNPFP